MVDLTSFRKIVATKRVHGEKAIAKRLGVTEHGLSLLAKAVANPWGELGGGNGATKLHAQGYAYRPDLSQPHLLNISEAGRNLVKRARALGW